MREGKRRVPYHCAFMIDQSTGLMRFGLAWRRVGARDHGIFVAADPEPGGLFFSAGYSSRGEVSSFEISESAPKAGASWEEERVANSPGQSGPEEEEAFEALAEGFWRDWLESFGASEAAEVLKRFSSKPQEKSNETFSEAFRNKMPLRVRKEAMPALLAKAEMSESGRIFALIEEGGEPSMNSGRSARNLMESKMRGFLDLL